MTPVDDLAEQTGAALQYVSDLRDISATEPHQRVTTNPEDAAVLLKHELLSRLTAVFDTHPGDPFVLLSGGVDSIAVAAAAVHLGLHPHAITVSTATGTDTTNATTAAAALGLSHSVIELDDEDVAKLARDAVIRVGTPELWEVSYAIPLLAITQFLDRQGTVGPILTGSAADAILAGGKTLHNPIDSLAAIGELDRIVRKESAANFRFQRLVPDFYSRVLPAYEDRFVHVFQTVRFWQIAETFAPPALFGDHDGRPADKLCLRLVCEGLLPASAAPLAWAQKSAIQQSAGIMPALGQAARRSAARLPGAQTYTDPLVEPYEAVATRLFLALLATDSDGQENRK